MAEEISLNAYAKINLSLDVLRRREDGYHDVKMIMQTIGLHDELTFKRRDDDRVVLKSDDESLPTDKDNLIIKACDLFFSELGSGYGLDIFLKKSIPTAAGLAGGSSDAAATLKALNKMAGDPFDDEGLRKMGVKIGADIPFCLMGGTALSEGIGEILTPLPSPRRGNEERFIVIAKPPAAVSTAFVYKNLKLDDNTEHPDVDGMADALKKGDYNGIIKRLGNVLESVTIPAYPEIGKIKEIAILNGAEGSLMSGSGPTVFALFDNKDKAQGALLKLKESGLCRDLLITDFM